MKGNFATNGLPANHPAMRPTTNRWRFNSVIGATPPIDHDAVGNRGERMVEVHRFFGEQAREWLGLNSFGTT